MPKISEMIQSKFLKKEDVGGERGVVVTISDCIEVNVSLPGADAEMKWALVLEEFDKPLVLNTTNIQLCQKVCGGIHSDDWVGKKIVLYEEPNVSLHGKLVGGIRIRAVRTKQEPVVPERKEKPKPAEDY